MKKSFFSFWAATTQGDAILAQKAKRVKHINCVHVCKKALFLTLVCALVFGFVACSDDDDDDDDDDSGGKKVVTQPEKTEDVSGTPQTGAFTFGDYNFECTQDYSAKLANDGSYFVISPKEGAQIKTTDVAVKLTSTCMSSIKSTIGDKFFIEMTAKVITQGQGSEKNFGPASHITTGQDGKTATYYYGGINYNGRTQLGTKQTPKGMQFGSLASDTTVLGASVGDYWYKMRYEVATIEGNTTITSYINDVQYNKSGTTTYTLGQKDTKAQGDFTLGVIASGDTFKVTSFKVGSITALGEGKFAQLKVQVQEAGDFKLLSENQTKYLLPLESTWAVRVGKTANFSVTSKDATGADDANWSVESSAPVVVKAQKSDDGTGFSIEALSNGSATVTLKNATDNAIKRTFVCDIQEALKFPTTEAVTLQGKISPQKDATGVFEDERLRLTFDATPTLNEGSFYIYEVATDGTVDIAEPADEIKIGTESDTIALTQLTLKNFMVQIAGNDIIIIPHKGSLKAGKTYAIGVASGVVTGKIAGQDFNGLDPQKKSWAFTTRASYTPTSSSAITVASTGEGDFRSVQSAIEVATTGAVITVKSGTYYEIIRGNKALTIKGDTQQNYGADVIIKGINCNSYNGGTNTRCVLYWNNADLTLENLTIQNAYNRNTMGGTSQSEALYFDAAGGRLAAYNCSFLGQQDTLLTKGKNWFYKCYIEGDTDFIWGYADVCLLEECKLKMIDTSRDTIKATNAIIFETRVVNLNSEAIPKGYVLFNSEVEAAHAGGCYLERRASNKQGDPAKDYYDQAAVINTKFTGDNLKPNLWGAADGVGQSELCFIEKEAGNQNVGLKAYNIKDKTNASITIPQDKDYAGTLTSATYTAEYSGRNAILNKVYNKTKKAYEAVPEAKKWEPATDYSAWNATSDTSVVEYQQTQINKYTFNFKTLTGLQAQQSYLNDAIPSEETPNKTLTCANNCVKWHGATYGAVTAGEATVTIPVFANSNVYVYQSYKATTGATVKLGQGDAKPFADSTDAKTDEALEAAKITLSYTGEAGTATLTFSSKNMYMAKIVVVNNDVSQ